MLKTILIIILAIAQMDSLVAQNKRHHVIIKVSSDIKDSTSKIFISGNKLELGNWNPNQIELVKCDSYWQKDFIFDDSTTLEFKFTQGSWDSEALDNNGKIPQNYFYNIICDTVLRFTIEKWNSENDSANLEPKATGNIKYHKDVKYKNLLPRDIIVWLPPGYEENKSIRYPVLYMHDGQNIFDPQTSFTGIDWQMDEAADSLIRKKEITPIIIVGIYNTFQRTMEYTPGPLNDIYKEFVTDYLKPIIDSTYRTYPDRNNTFVGGSSYGGTISFILLWEYSHIFSKAACFSPGFITSEMNYVDEVKESEIHDEVKLYLDNGGIGLETEIQIGIDSMITVLQNKGLKAGEDFYYILDKKAEHNEIAWAKRVPSMMKILFGK